MALEKVVWNDSDPYTSCQYSLEATDEAALVGAVKARIEKMKAFENPKPLNCSLFKVVSGSSASYMLSLGFIGDAARLAYERKSQGNGLEAYGSRLWTDAPVSTQSWAVPLGGGVDMGKMEAGTRASWAVLPFKNIPSLEAIVKKDPHGDHVVAMADELKSLGVSAVWFHRSSATCLHLGVGHGDAEVVKEVVNKYLTRLSFLDPMSYLAAPPAIIIMAHVVGANFIGRVKNCK